MCPGFFFVEKEIFLTISTRKETKQLKGEMGLLQAKVFTKFKIQKVHLKRYFTESNKLLK